MSNEIFIQVISVDQAAAGLKGRFHGLPTIEYVVDRPPYLRYRWNGSTLVPIDGGRPNGTSASSYSYTYDSLGRLATEASEGVTYTYNYSATNGALLAITGGGITRTQQYDAFGRFTGETLS